MQEWMVYTWILVFLCMLFHFLKHSSNVSSPAMVLGIDMLWHIKILYACCFKIWNCVCLFEFLSFRDVMWVPSIITFMFFYHSNGVVPWKTKMYILQTLTFLYLSVVPWGGAMSFFNLCNKIQLCNCEKNSNWYTRYIYLWRTYPLHLDLKEKRTEEQKLSS